MPLMGEQPDLAEVLSNYAATLPQKPSAILIFTAHWETHQVVVSSGAQHSLYFDYGGFPPETYQYKYPAPGNPELAKRVRDLLNTAGIASESDPKRGWDHGVFVPLMLMFPDATIPVVQISVLHSQSAEEHLRVGEALQPLRGEGVLIVGSGQSVHNFYWFAKVRMDAGIAHSVNWDDWLQATLLGEGLNEKQRREHLAAWDTAPSARECHARGLAEHLMPLFCVAGAGGLRSGRRVGSARLPDKFATSGFEFH